MRKWLRIRQFSLILLSVICSEILLPAGGLIASAAVKQLEPEISVVSAAAVAKSAATPPDATLPETTLPEATPPDATLPDATPPGSAIPVATGSDAAMPEEPLPDSDHLLSDKNPSMRMVKPATPFDADWVEAATFEELESAMGNSRKIRLVDDIIISGFHYIISSTTEPTHIDTNGHTIYVEGIAMVIGSIVSGKNQEGLFYVREGGLLSLYGTTLKPEDGYAFWQEEGSGLIHDVWKLDDSPEIPCSFEGEFHYAERPAAWYPEGGFDFGDSDQDPSPDPYYLFDAGTPFDSEALPKEAAAYWCYEGKLHSGWLPVEWNVEECGEELEKRERTLLTGSYGAGMVTLHTSVPKLLTVFQKEEAGVWLTCEYWENPNMPRIVLDFLPARPDSAPETYMLEVSVDGTEWGPLNSVTCSGPDSDGIYTYKGRFNVWSGEIVPQYYCIRVQGQETDFYSDIIMITEEDSFARGDIDGTRGGGTQIGDPNRPSDEDTPGDPNTPPPGDTPGDFEGSNPGNSTGPSDTPSQGGSVGNTDDSNPGDATGSPDTPLQGGSDGNSEGLKPGGPAGTPDVPSQGGSTGNSENSKPGGTTENREVQLQKGFEEKPGDTPVRSFAGNPGSPRQEDAVDKSGSPRQEAVIEDSTSPHKKDTMGDSTSPHIPMQNPDDLSGMPDGVSDSRFGETSTGDIPKDSIPVKTNGPAADRAAAKETAAFPEGSRMGQQLTGWAATAGIIGFTLWLAVGDRKKKELPPEK